ncbi:DUF5684 domain-containing protein [Microbacterium sp. PRF11]|uniref:DUF5684 domain-containing protein n=1 Tax=Microbacterium sp. PRF11 TaxID=2962593 RepID=UPI0028815240|nr:DUF5684 domain-containing protein [Microbacterium sp. PRF11]MDT0115660.1 DUF5684 domain-containing protein [Microbacterium sp. PRF11]
MLTSSPSSITEQTSLFALNGTTSLVAVAMYVLMVVALWRVFSKAGYAGWLAIIPIVNVVFLTKVAGFSGWLALLYLIPIVGFVFHIVVQLRVGRAFGHGWVFSIFLLALFYVIGYLIIGFSDDRYRLERVR